MLTWGDIKKAFADAGVQDEEPIAYIDLDSHLDLPIQVRRNDDGELEIM